MGGDQQQPAQRRVVESYLDSQQHLRDSLDALIREDHRLLTTEEELLHRPGLEREREEDDRNSGE